MNSASLSVYPTTFEIAGEAFEIRCLFAEYAFVIDVYDKVRFLCGSWIQSAAVDVDASLKLEIRYIYSNLIQKARLTATFSKGYLIFVDVSRCEEYEEMNHTIVHDSSLWLCGRFRGPLHWLETWKQEILAWENKESNIQHLFKMTKGGQQQKQINRKKAPLKRQFRMSETFERTTTGSIL